MSNHNTEHELRRLFTLKESRELDRMGALFNTERANYYYDTGMDVEAIRRYYIDGYSDACIQHCAHCWAIRLCNVCYAKRMTKDGFDTASFKGCASKKEVLLHNLAFYHELMETESGKETLKVLKDATFI